MLLKLLTLVSRANQSNGRPSSPSQRRLYRILADRLGLNHQLKFLVNKDNKLELNLIVTKDVMQCSEPALSSLNFIKECDFRQDINFRQIDGEPYRWADVKKEISKQDDAIIYIVSQKFAKAMSGYPSISWLLLWVEIHRERGIPLPEGFLRAAVQMCSARNDIYGLLEVLYLNYEEQFLITHDTRQRQISAHVLEVNYCEGELFTEADSAIDNLSKSDWNKAFSTALRSVTDNVNSASHRQGFIEVQIKTSYATDS